MNESPPILALASVSMAFGAVRALQDVSLELWYVAGPPR